MRSYEVTYIVDSTLENDKIKKTAKQYQDMLTTEGATIVAVNEIGLKQLAYPIKKNNTGVYFTIEYKAENGEVIDKIDLIFRRDERILRFLSVRLDKYVVKYNEDKRAGIIDERKNKLAAERAQKREEEDAKNKARKASNKKARKKATAKPEPTVEVPADVAKTAEEATEAAPAPTVEVPADVAKPAAEVKEAVENVADASNDSNDSDNKA